MRASPLGGTIVNHRYAGRVCAKLLIKHLGCLFPGNEVVDLSPKVASAKKEAKEDNEDKGDNSTSSTTSNGCHRLGMRFGSSSRSPLHAWYAGG
jgi:hypothetical protein